MERRWEPSVEITPNCPRCGSSNTKFCYYNNYSLTQPRYFCKGCRRYWTKGGSLRNVPVGGGCRKNRRGKSLLRMPTDGVPSQSLSSGLVPHYDNKVNALSESNTSSATSDGSHIDLALVFANFLNNKHPENKSGFELPEFRSELGPSKEFTNTESNLQLSGENGLTNIDQIYYSGLESVHQHQDGFQVQQCRGHETSNNALPPFPGDDLSSQEYLLWPNSHPLQATEEPVLGPETHDPNLLFSNWSAPFDLSSEDIFSRT